MNNTLLNDLSVREMLTVAGGEDGPRLTCFIDGAAFAGSLLLLGTSPLGAIAGVAGAAWAWDSARTAGCFN